LRNAKAMLLVDYYQAELCESNVPAQKRVRANDQIDGSRRQAIEHGSPLVLTQGARENAETQTQSFYGRPQGLCVLVRKELGGGQKDRLRPTGSDLRAGDHRHCGLSGSHIALEKTTHGDFTAECRAHLANRCLLCSRQLERECA
jgi:hypothetical protein